MFKGTYETNERTGKSDKLQSFFHNVLSTTPCYVIDQNGGFAGVVGLKALADAMRREVEVLFADPPRNLKQQLENLIDNALSEPQMLCSLASQWNRDVGQWIETEDEGRSHRCPQSSISNYSCGKPMAKKRTGVAGPFLIVLTTGITWVACRERLWPMTRDQTSSYRRCRRSSRALHKRPDSSTAYRSLDS